MMHSNSSLQKKKLLNETQAKHMGSYRVFVQYEEIPSKEMAGSGGMHLN